MSFGIHIYMADKFSEQSYRRFPGEVQNLFGKWDLVESWAFRVNPRYENMHECWIESHDFPVGENVRVNVEATHYVKGVSLGKFDYEWALHFETTVARSVLGLAVQLGSLLLAMESFKWFLVIDRDSSLEHEPTEFRSKEAVYGHVRRLLEEDFPTSCVELKRRGILDLKQASLRPELAPQDNFSKFCS